MGHGLCSEGMETGGPDLQHLVGGQLLDHELKQNGFAKEEGHNWQKKASQRGWNRSRNPFDGPALTPKKWTDHW